ncbi:MAG: leucine--tRNA ligase [Microgenomates group bacterium]
MDFKEIEAKWQKFWSEHPELYRADDPAVAGQVKPKKYILNEFPYPSGSGLHVGHAFSFTGGDVFARFKRMQGYNVLFPMGWDAFGLPTENFAIKMKKKPQVVTKENTDMFRSQMDRLAFSYDWSREVDTTDPNYYKWTQWIFVKLFKAGLAYKKEMPINWCPSCKIGLANEEVIDNKCERCGSEVSRRNISQWVVKITDYADRLIDGLKETNFIDKVKQAQINWIGRKEGLIIDFVVDGNNTKISCFTKYPETIFGTSWVVVSPEYPELDCLVTEENRQIVDEYIKESQKKSEMDRTSGTSEKTGVFTGSYVINPVNNKKIPVWVGDYVLANFGTGAVMGVAPHDSRDFMFAKKYGLEMIQVEVPKDKPNYVIDSYEKVIEDGVMINSEQFSGMRARDEAYKAISDWMVENKWATRKVEYHLRDWIFSRQHYWGEPIPMVYCESCARHGGQGWVPEKEENLPIVLPEVEAYEPTDDGLSPLSRIPEFVNCTCPKCGGPAKRETDTMPNWAGSDWYFLRYMDPHNNSKLVDSDILKYWGPVDVYIGGDEHNTLHLLYSRFIYQFLYDLHIFPEELTEPYYMRMSHGVILGPDNQRMSKTKGNVIVPEVVADKYGVDVVRMYLMFMGPFTGTMAWSENTLMGVKRFLDRFEKYISEQINTSNASNSDVKVIINKLIDGVTRDLEVFGYNTVVAKLMGALNELSVTSYQLRVNDVETLIKLIAPMAPYMAEEMWSRLGHIDSVHQQSWPVVDPKYLVDDQVKIMISINGKVRDELIVNSEQLTDKRNILQLAKETEKMKVWLADKTISKEIYVEGRMVNFVILAN